MGGGEWGWGAGSSENKANLAQLGLELGLSLAIRNMNSYILAFRGFLFLVNVFQVCVQSFYFIFLYYEQVNIVLLDK